mgnify:CR=1 FL=1|tara:strand:- start:836 stop:2614 length:1779 start_codon:yes stop_codon:yes gene_type:complete
MPTRRKFRRNTRNKNKSRRKRQRGGEVKIAFETNKPDNFKLDNWETIKIILNLDEFTTESRPCPGPTKAAMTRNGTDQCNSSDNIDKFTNWFKKPISGKKNTPVDKNWYDRNKGKDWYKKAFIYAFRTNICKTVIQKVTEKLNKNEIKDMDAINRAISQDSSFLKKYADDDDITILKNSFDEKKKKNEKKGEIAQFSSKITMYDVQQYTREKFKDGILQNTNFKGDILFATSEQNGWENKWNEIISSMNKPIVEGTTPPRKGWTKEIGGTQQDPYKRKELFETAIKYILKQLKEKFPDDMKNDEALLKSQMNHDGPIQTNPKYKKKFSDFLILPLIFTYIFLPGHKWNDLLKKDKDSDDNTKGLDAYGLKKNVFQHLFNKFIEFTEKQYHTEDVSKTFKNNKEANYLFTPWGINAVDGLINLIENHFKNKIQKGNGEDGVIIEDLQKQLKGEILKDLHLFSEKTEDGDKKSSFDNNANTGATQKGKTLDGVHIRSAIKFQLIRFLRHIVQTPELSHVWCFDKTKSVSNTFKMDDLSKLAKISKFKYKITEKGFEKITIKNAKCTTGGGGRKTRRRRRKRKRKKTRRRRRRRR